MRGETAMGNIFDELVAGDVQEMDEGQVATKNLSQYIYRSLAGSFRVP